VFDFDRDHEIATHPKDNSDIGAVEPRSAHARSGAAQQSGHPIDNVRVRGVIINPASRQFLAMVNNRVTPGSMTVMLPGGAVEQGEGELSALARQIRDELGITVQLGPDNCRFLLSRTYEFPEAQGTTSCRLNFYAVVSDDAVPRNMTPDSILSVSWMSLSDLHRYLALDNGGWKIQLGALDAVEAALDPAKAKVVDGKAREVARQDGGSPPSKEVYSKPARMPYGGE
jgi:8-oxo-dGTP pyrophosphatase MutT (NUDIX family)